LRRVGALRVRVNEHHDLSRDGLLPPLERRRRRNGLAGHRRARLLGRVDQRECRYSGGWRDLSHGTVASGRRHRCFARHRRMGGRRVHHQWRRDAPEPGATVVVLLHGMTGTHLVYRTLARELCGDSRSLSLLAPDLRGRRRSAHARGVTGVLAQPRRPQGRLGRGHRRLRPLRLSRVRERGASGARDVPRRPAHPPAGAERIPPRPAARLGLKRRCAGCRASTPRAVIAGCVEPGGRSA
jgi:hypothetical protein